MTTRRAFLASGGAAGTALLPGWLPLFGDEEDSTDDREPTTAEREDEFGMTVDYPEMWLQRYRPAFVANRTTIRSNLSLTRDRGASDRRLTFQNVDDAMDEEKRRVLDENNVPKPLEVWI